MLIKDIQHCSDCRLIDICRMNLCSYLAIKHIDVDDFCKYAETAKYETFAPCKECPDDVGTCEDCDHESEMADYTQEKIIEHVLGSLGLDYDSEREKGWCSVYLPNCEVE